VQDNFRTEVTAAGDETRISVHGDVDVQTAARLGEQLGELVAGRARRIIIDLRDVPFCDSTGLTVLVKSSNRLRDGGRQLVLRSPSNQVRRVLDVTGLGSIFTVEYDPAG
jgi:anti-sigma B factor antagonist